MLTMLIEFMGGNRFRNNEQSVSYSVRSGSYRAYRRPMPEDECASWGLLCDRRKIELSWVTWLFITAHKTDTHSKTAENCGQQGQYMTSAHTFPNATVADTSIKRCQTWSVATDYTQASVDRECPTCLQRHLSNILKYFFRLSIPKHNPNPNLKPKP